jgi:hypothetical protein
MLSALVAITYLVSGRLRRDGSSNEIVTSPVMSRMGIAYVTLYLQYFFSTIKSITGVAVQRCFTVGCA